MNWFSQLQGKPSPLLYEARGFVVRTWNEITTARLALSAVDYFLAVVFGTDASPGTGASSLALNALDYFLAVVFGADASPGEGTSSALLNAVDYFLAIVTGADASPGTGLTSLALSTVDYFLAVVSGQDSLAEANCSLAMLQINYAP